MTWKRVFVSLVVGVAIMGVVATASEGDSKKSRIPSGKLFVEMDASRLLQADGSFRPTSCTMVHMPGLCIKVHIDDFYDLGDGDWRITLSNDVTYAVSWAGLGVTLDNAAVIAPPRAGSAPTEWIQVYPYLSDVSVREWKDIDGDSSLSPSDSITIDGTLLKVTASHFYMWLEPVK